MKETFYRLQSASFYPQKDAVDQIYRKIESAFDSFSYNVARSGLPELFHVKDLKINVYETPNLHLDQIS